MATRKTSPKSRSRQPESPVAVEEIVTSTTVVSSSSSDIVIPRNRLYIGLLLLLILLALFWHRTNTWPVAAVVNGMPITRFEVNQALTAQGGDQVLDGIITERLVKQELKRQNVTVNDEEIAGRIDEIKTNLGESFDAALAAQGLTMDELQKQISTQIKIEKLLADSATASAAEIDELEEQVGDRAQAEKMVKQQKLQQAISDWVEGLRSQAKIVLIGKSQASATE